MAYNCRITSSMAKAWELQLAFHGVGILGAREVQGRLVLAVMFDVVLAVVALPATSLTGRRREGVRLIRRRRGRRLLRVVAAVSVIERRGRRRRGIGSVRGLSLAKKHVPTKS